MNFGGKFVQGQPKPFDHKGHIVAEPQPKSTTESRSYTGENQKKDKTEKRESQCHGIAVLTRNKADHGANPKNLREKTDFAPLVMQRRQRAKENCNPHHGWEGY